MFVVDTELAVRECPEVGARVSCGSNRTRFHGVRFKHKQNYAPKGLRGRLRDVIDCHESLQFAHSIVNKSIAVHEVPP
jgi:hypothetical protein